MAPVEKKIKEIIIVEGKNDTAAVKRALDAETIETGGSFVSEAVLSQIKRAHETRGVIVLTDPDHAGERIRRKIHRMVPGVKHAFISKEEGMKEGDVGVEHASPDAIRRALSKAHDAKAGGRSPLTWDEFIDLGLVGGENAAEMRDLLGSALGVGYGNAKRFFDRLTMLGVKREEFFLACQHLWGGEKKNG